MKRAEFAGYLHQVKGWVVAKNAKSISREFKFKNFVQAMKFLNNVAKIVKQEGHYSNIWLHN